MGRCGKVRVPYAEVDEVDTYFPLFGFHLVDPCKKIRREIAHAACVHKYVPLALASIEFNSCTDGSCRNRADSIRL